MNNKNKYTLPIFIIALALILFGFYSFFKNKESANSSNEQVSIKNIADSDIDSKADFKNKINNKENSDRFPKYEDIELSSLEGNIILDFSAKWCSSCQAFKKDVQKNIDKIPKNTTIVLVDFDNSFKLRKKYKVTTQHTFVQVKSNGDEIKKWRGSPTLDQMLKEIKDQN